MRHFALPFLATVFFAAPSLAEDLGLKAPPGFEVSLYAGDDLAHDIFSMTLDAKGRVVVAGRDYVKTLHDDDNDGRADRASVFSTVPKSGAHGLYFDGEDLICTGDDSVLRLREGAEPIRLAKLRHPEHGANGVIQGPDGWLYIICGNDSGIGKDNITTKTSPIREPQSGGVVRMTLDGSKSEVVAHGFRNPYDLDFGPNGNLFTYDSDGERDHHLPWYVPTRIFDIAEGMHHGWVLQGWTRSWSRPASFCDNVRPVALIGRGSPTGVTVYRHTKFPAEYRDNLFALCWTMGRVYRFVLKEDGDSFVSKPETFLETTGEVGFAPVDIAIGREGEMYIAIGGRRTRGSVFRIDYRGRSDGDGLRDDLRNVLDAPQPLAAWSRAEWVPLAKKLGREPIVAAINSERPIGQCVRAVEVLTELFDGLTAQEADGLHAQLPPPVAARVAWSLGRTMQNETGAKLLALFAKRKEPVVQRAAWTALAALSPEVAVPVVEMNGGDRITAYVRALALARSANPGDDPLVLAAGGKLGLEHFSVCVAKLRTALANRNSPDERGALAAVRLLQLSLGDINVKPQPQEFRTGCSATCDPAERQRLTAPHHLELATTFPTGLAEVDRELARLLAMLEIEDVALAERISAKCNGDSSPQDDLHFLIAGSCLPGRRSATTTALIAAALVSLPKKMEDRDQYPSRNWPARVEELVARLVEVDPQLPAALLADNRFALPAHALYAKRFPKDAKIAAARKLTREALENGPEEPRWTPTLLELSDSLPREDALPFLREAAEDFALRDSALLRLTKEPQLVDRGLLIAGLDSIQPEIIAATAKALAKFDTEPGDVDQVRALSALRQACLAPDARDARQALTVLLAKWSDQTFTIEEKKDNLPGQYQPIFTWFAENRPAVAAKLREFGGGDAASWRERLEKITWDGGDVARGKTVFEKRSCVRCHSGTGPLGPDLAGAAGRFARDDLFAAIVDPNKDVSPTYQTTQVVTRGGRSYHGLVVYESPDGTLLQTGPDVTVRIAGDEVISMRKSKGSLMPTGLLNGAADGELADLYAYLRTLKAMK